MPQEPMVIATKAVNGNANVFDVRKHSSFPRDSVCRPNMVLTGHEKEGYGLSWSPLHKGLLASGSDDARVCVWDVCASSAASCTPIRTYCEQKDVVEDLELDRNIRRLFLALDHCLTEREYRIVVMRYGILGCKEHTQQEVGDVLGISRSYVSRMEKRALHKLAEALRED